jgi:8-oxo-dGTP pyrophosphatase MutT (NUDIX family)
MPWVSRSVIPEPAATVILLREGDPFEVLMVERNARGMFGSLMVFPGGGVETRDVPAGRDRADEESHRNAAIRELAEETGILLTPEGAVSARSVDGRPTAASSLVLVSRWVTPEYAPRRYDTRFYLAFCDNTPEVVIDTNELVDHAWLTPSQALDRHERDHVQMILPTLAHIRWLMRRVSIRDALDSAREADARTMVRPHRAEDGSLIPTLLPADPGA